ncbi:MAG: DsbE family thiol:disulfide interchange protein [Pseudomonadota bacterium]
MRLLFLAPLAVALGIGGFLYWGLDSERDPSIIPSVRIDKPVPEFALPAIDGVGVPGFSQADLVGMEGPALVNVFASWCFPCRVEHPVLVRMVDQHGIRLFGLNYKDAPEAARDWLAEVGNPYTAVGSDVSGRAGIEWGVVGVPETFVINAEGTVLMRHVGPITTPEAEAALLAALRDAEPQS